MENKKNISPWFWIPSLYFMQGIPFIIAMELSVVMYKDLEISNAEIAFYTSWLYLPWVIKPIWSPFVDMFKTKRLWIVLFEFVIGALLACVALSLPLPHFFQYTIAIFWLMAFSSATHDIAADGFYMLALREYQQAAFAGVRNIFFRVAKIATQGGIVILIDQMEKIWGKKLAWSYGFGIMAFFFFAFFVYHKIILPYPITDKPTFKNYGVIQEFFYTFAAFFQKKNILGILAFLLLYRFAESQLVKLVSPFLLDTKAKGGLELTKTEVGFAYGTVGVIALLIGGILGGYLISKKGLKYWLWPMALILNLPDIVYVFLSQVQPSLFSIHVAIAIEQFGYGFGFTAYMLFMIMVSEGENKTAHYAICTGFMALGMMIPGMFSGKLQEMLGYQYFFLWVMISTTFALLVVFFVDIDPEFGKKT